MNTQVLRGHNIICFGSEKWGYPGFQQSTMKLLSENNRILYINPLGTRKVSFQSRNFGAYYRKVLSVFSGKRTISENIVAYNPFLIPFMYNKTVQELNKYFLRQQFTKLVKDLAFENYILWVGTPSAAPIIDLFSPILLIYNPVDRYFAFSFVSSKGIRTYEKKVASRADLVIVTSDAIKKDLHEYNSNCEVVNHGVFFDHFSKAIGNLEAPADMKKQKKPIIGYFGGISEWVNIDLIKTVALTYKHANVVLIGRSNVDMSLFEGIRNVHVMGHKDFEDLPAYLKCFDVCLIPFHINELIQGVDPIKLREYLCAGKPVVTTNFPEAMKLDQLIYIGKDDEDFIDKVGKALRENDKRLVKQRIDKARQEGWHRKIQIISSIIQTNLIKKLADGSLNSS